MMQQLGQLEQMQQLLQQAQAAASACQGEGQGLGQGMSMAQAMRQWMQGGGMGQRGQGSGGKAPNSRTPFGRRLQKADVPVVDGEIIASMLIDGTPMRGVGCTRSSFITRSDRNPMCSGSWYAAKENVWKVSSQP